MRLERNIQAPVFQLTDIYGRSIGLNDYRDKKVLIGFFRHAGCPFCNIRVHALSKARAELREQGLEMIFFFESTQRVLLNSIFHKETSPVPIISDPQKEWYAAYGLEPSVRKSVYSHLTAFVQTAYQAATLGAPMHAMASGESFSTMPAEFLLGEGLVVREVHYSETLNDRIGLEKIKAFAKEETVPQSF